jgi:molybdopterin synthase catalytic subunit
LSGQWKHKAGALMFFIGTVRSETKGKKVVRLEFEAYESMALSELKKIAEQVFEKFPVQKFSFIIARVF